MRGRLGPYEILAPIGSGGMGEVYRARDTRLDRLVAIKVVKSTHLSNPTARARFEREARAVAALDHPHICALYDVGHEDDIEYLVMQYLDGETLASRLHAGPLTIPEALKFGSQIAHAIDAAHRRGITHRDLKPSNVMLTKSGAVLLDFGLAKLEGTGDTPTTRGDSTETANITREGTVLGTVRYMSPEALERRSIDGRSDVFSLGAVLYEMVTGQRAFDADSDARVIATILSAEPRPLRELRPDAPAELESLIATCLAKDPENRWQSAHDVAKQIDAIAGSRSTTPAPISSGTQRRLYRPQPRWMAAAAVASLAGVVYMGWPARGIAPPAHLVALPCEADDSWERALCDGLTEALIGRVVRLTQTHRIQVTPQVGGLLGNLSTIADAQYSSGATHVIQSRASGGQVVFALTASGQNQSLTIETKEIFDAEEGAVSWLVRSLGLELSPVERESLVARATSNAGVRAVFLRGRGWLRRAKSRTDFDLSIEAFTAAAAADPSYAAAQTSLGMAWRGIYLRGGDAASRAKAEAACAESVRIQPSSSEGHTCLGMLHADARQLERAAAELARATQSDPTNDDAIVWLGRTQEQLHLPIDAERTYTAAIEARPDYYNPRVWAANFYRRQTRYPEATLALTDAVRLVPGNAVLHAALATPLMWTGRYENALAESDRALAIRPTMEAYVAKGMTLFRMRRFEQAAGVIELARAGASSNPTVLGSLARAYYWWATPDARAKAAAYFQEAVSQLKREAENPTGRLPKADIHISLADYCAKLGRADEAKLHLQQVGLNVDSPDRPTDSHQLFFAALVYAQLGDRESSIKWLDRALYWGVPVAELQAWPELDTLRSDRAFQALIRVH